MPGTGRKRQKVGAGDFRRLRWGMTRAEVLALEPEWCVDGIHTAGNEELLAIPFRVSTEFGDHGLAAIRYRLRGTLGPQSGYWSAIEELGQALAAELGPAELEGAILSHDASVWGGPEGRAAAMTGYAAWVKQWSVGGRTRVRLALQRGMEDVDKMQPLVIKLSYTALPSVMPRGGAKP